MQQSSLWISHSAIPIFRRVKLTDRKSPMFGNVYRRCSVHRKLSREANSPAEISITRFHDNTSHPATFPFTNSIQCSLSLSLSLSLSHSLCFSPSTDLTLVTSVYCRWTSLVFYLHYFPITSIHEVIMRSGFVKWTFEKMKFSFVTFIVVVSYFSSFFLRSLGASVEGCQWCNFEKSCEHFYQFLFARGCCSLSKTSVLRSRVV